MEQRVAGLGVTLILAASTTYADALDGRWRLNVARSHYGPGATPRQEETFVCASTKDILECTIDSRRVDGTRVLGTFAAAHDGTPHRATGIPDVDEVAVRRVDDYSTDATFSYKGRPVFGYRAIKSDDGQSLTIVSVDPTARTVLTSVVVYDRQSLARSGRE